MSSKTIRPVRALPLLAVLAAFLALPAFASAAATYSMRWNGSVALENPNDGGGFDSVSCAPAAAGATTSGTSTATAPSLLCVAGDIRGEIWTTVHPARTKAFWHPQRIDAWGTAITGVSCPSTQLCVAVDAAGQVMHSTNPAGGVKYWSKPARIDKVTQPGGGYAGLSAISCPTTQLCVAVDNAANGQVAYTTNPAGPASGWTLVTVGNGVTLDSVACASATLCLIGGNERFYSTTPTGGAGAWKATGSLSSSVAVIASLSCNTVKLCVGVGYGNAGAGLASASPTPALGASGWSQSQIGSAPPAQGAQLVDAVSCPQRNFCVAADGASNVYTSSTPVRGNWTAAKPLKKASQATVSAISCNSVLCVEVDNRGTVTYGAVKSGTSTTGTTKTSTTTTKTSTGTTTTKTSTSTTKTTG
jgi:hypothetical protein